MQCASSTTSSPHRAARSGSCSARNRGLLRRSGLTRSTSTASAASCSRTAAHSSALAELMVTALIPARWAAAIWSRISASSGETITVGPAPAARRSAVATKYTADLPHPVRWTTSTRSRRSTSASIASYCPSRKSASGRPTRVARACCAWVRIALTLDDAGDTRRRASGRGLHPPCARAHCCHRSRGRPVRSIPLWKNYCRRAVGPDMTTERIPLSVLELAPRSQGMTPQQALAESTRLAQEVDRLGYHRLWVAEHHNTEAFLSSATSLLLGHFAQHTERIRLGSGGVMLPNHAPLMVAEYYGTLATLYGDRFDLGLGRAPGTDPLTAAALRRGNPELDGFAQEVADLAAYLDEEHPDRKVRAYPGQGTKIPLWMLGSSVGGAQVAAALGLPFSFASHFAPQMIREALALYRERFNPDAPTAQVDRPTVMAGAGALVAPTEDEARYLFTTNQLMSVRIRTGQSAPLDPPVQDLAAVLPPQLLQVAQDVMGINAVGTPEQVATRLQEFADEHDLDELIITTYVYDPQLRRRSFQLLAAEWGLSA